jgi:hypothetical protein
VHTGKNDTRLGKNGAVGDLNWRDNKQGLEGAWLRRRKSDPEVAANSPGSNRTGLVLQAVWNALLLFLK